jgi:hypothetical protein
MENGPLKFFGNLPSPSDLEPKSESNGKEDEYSAGGEPDEYANEVEQQVCSEPVLVLIT